MAMRTMGRADSETIKRENRVIDDLLKGGDSFALTVDVQEGVGRPQIEALCGKLGAYGTVKPPAAWEYDSGDVTIGLTPGNPAQCRAFMEYRGTEEGRRLILNVENAGGGSGAGTTDYR